MWLWLRRKNGKSHKSRAIFLLSSSLSFEEIVLQLQLRGEHQRLQSCQLSVSSLWLCKANRLKARFPALHWSIAHIRFGSASLTAYHPAQWAVSAPTQFNQPQLLVGLWLWIELWDAHTYPHTHNTYTINWSGEWQRKKILETHASVFQWTVCLYEIKLAGICIQYVCVRVCIID